MCEEVVTSDCHRTKLGPRTKGYRANAGLRRFYRTKQGLVLKVTVLTRDNINGKDKAKPVGLAKGGLNKSMRVDEEKQG